NRAAEEKTDPQQQHENSDGRHLRGRRPDVLGRLDGLRILDAERVALFATGAGKLHFRLQNAGGTGSVSRNSTPPPRPEFPSAASPPAVEDGVTSVCATGAGPFRSRALC